MGSNPAVMHNFSNCFVLVYKQIYADIMIRVCNGMYLFKIVCTRLVLYVSVYAYISVLFCNVIYKVYTSIYKYGDTYTYYIVYTLYIPKCLLIS